jgi:hypothetical protein
MLILQLFYIIIGLKKKDVRKIMHYVFFHKENSFYKKTKYNFQYSDIIKVKKHILFILLLSCFVLSNIFARDDDYTIQTLITTISEPKSPVVKDGYIIFTSDSSRRSVGIVFDFENFSKIHQFEKLTFFDTDSKPVSSVYFFIQKIPPETTEIKYSLIIDGLWTRDPLNNLIAYDSEIRTKLSKIYIDMIDSPVTRQVTSNFVHFVYEGKSGETIRLGGSFTNWDSFIYELKETSEGFYELTLPLPKGKHYYAFYNGTESFTDITNPDKIYMLDGRKASVITLQ